MDLHMNHPHVNRHPIRRSGAGGFSLVELMVALLLGLLLTAGMVQLFTGTKQTFIAGEAQSRVQENGRFAMEMLKRELRQAGTHGFCAAQLNVRNHLNADAALDPLFDPIDANRALVGWEFSGTGRGDSYTLPADLTPPGGGGSWTATDIGNLPPDLVGEVVPGSDVLLTRRLEPIAGVTGTSGGPGPGGALTLDVDPALTGANGHGLEDNPVILVTDCASGADLFQVGTNQNSNVFSCGSGGGASPGNAGGGNCDWSTDYNDSMQAFRLSIVAYYIGMSDRGEPGLYRLELSRDSGSVAPDELVEGVENMQVLYGFSRAAPAGDGQSIDDWLDASQIPADGWGQVLGLRIGFTARSAEVADGNRTEQTFDLAEVGIQSAGDGRIRHAFTSAVALRNRVLVF